MKRCAACGMENNGDATRCARCGGMEWIDPPPGPGTAAPWLRVAVLDYEVEAEHLAAELTQRNIPHVMRSYHDSALDGLYQLSRGWGHVEAPREYRELILGILKDLREPGAESSAGGVAEGQGDAE